MGLARSTYYYDAPTRAADDTALVEAMAAICDAFEAYGWRRVQAALRQQGWVVNHKKVPRLMREHDLQPRVRRRYVITTDSDHGGPIFPNLVKVIVPGGPNQLWVVELTYVALTAGFVYVAIFLDAWMPGCLDAWMPGCLDAAGGRLCTQPFHRRPPDRRGPARGDRASSPSARTDPPHGPLQSICCRSVSESLGRARACWLDGSAQQSLR